MSSVEELLGLAPLEVGQRVRIAQSGECRGHIDQEHAPEEQGMLGVVELADIGEHGYFVQLHHAPALCAANDCTPWRRLGHLRFYARSELERIA